MPDVGVDFVQLDTGLRAMLIEQAEFYLLGGLAEDREVRATAVEGRSERVGGSGPGFQMVLLGEGDAVV